MTHLLGESCGGLTLEESIDLLGAKEKLISKLEKRVCELESEISNEKEKHLDKDAEIKEIKKELEERPTRKLVDDLREKLKMLEVEISKKAALLETTQKKIAELDPKIEKPDNKRISIFKKLFSMHASTSKVSKGSSKTNDTTPLTTPVTPKSTKLVFFKEGDGYNFDLEDLLRASAEVLGKSTFGTCYKAILESGQIVVVKRLKDMDLSESQFHEKVKQIGEIKHENILPLVTYYYNKDEKLFIYDHVPMGSVSEALHGKKDSGLQQLNWKTRVKIILLSSQSIRYIHSLAPTFCHGNIRSSNVLLTETYEARLSNPGLYSLLSTNSTHSGTDSYHAPEITDLRKMTQKADVYSFGVFIMELLSGKGPTRGILYQDDWVDLPSWVRSFERIKESIFDVQLMPTLRVQEDITQLMQVAVKCTEDNPVNRPSMTDVVAMIEDILSYLL